MDEGFPRQSLSFPFAQVSGQSDGPDIGLSFRSGTEENWSSSTVELMSDIYACVDPSLRSQLPSASISESTDDIGVVEAKEPITPLPTNARRGRAVPCAPRVKLRVLRPASTRIRKPPPELPCVSETKTTAAKPRKPSTRTGNHRTAKLQKIAPAPAPAPAPVVEAITMTLCEQEQEEFMQLLRDTIESNRNARNRRRTSLPTEDSYMRRDDREQTLDTGSDYTPPAIRVSQEPTRLPKKGLFSVPSPALQIIDTSPLVSPTPYPIDDGILAPVPVAAHKPVLGWFR